MKAGPLRRPIETTKAPGYGQKCFPVIEGIEERFKALKAVPQESYDDQVNRMSCGSGYGCGSVKRVWARYFKVWMLSTYFLVFNFISDIESLIIIVIISLYFTAQMSMCLICNVSHTIR